MIASKFKNIVKFILVSTIFFFILRVLYQNWNQLLEYEFFFNSYLLVASLLMLIVHYFILSFVWHVLTDKMHVHINYISSVKNWFYSQLWKYIPGRFGIMLGRAYLYQKGGVSIKGVSFAVLVEAVMSLIAACVIFLFSFFLVDELRGDTAISGNVIFIVSSITIVGWMVFLQPDIFQKVVNYALDLMKKERITVEWSYLDSIIIFCCYLLNWLVLGGAFYLFVNSFTPVPMNELFFLTGSLAFASVVSFISLFAPAGIGVREGILFIFLSRIMPESIAVILSIASRMWHIVTEIGVVVMIKGIDAIIASKGRKNVLDGKRSSPE